MKSTFSTLLKLCYTSRSLNISFDHSELGQKQATATSPSHKRGSHPHWVRLQSRESKEEETRNREDGQKNNHSIFTFLMLRTWTGLVVWRIEAEIFLRFSRSNIWAVDGVQIKYLLGQTLEMRYLEMMVKKFTVLFNFHYVESTISWYSFWIFYCKFVLLVIFF